MMKTINSCMQCQVEFGIPRFSTTELVEIPDDGVLWMTSISGTALLVFSRMNGTKY